VHNINNGIRNDFELREGQTKSKLTYCNEIRRINKDNVFLLYYHYTDNWYNYLSKIKIKWLSNKSFKKNIVYMPAKNSQS